LMLDGQLCAVSGRKCGFSSSAGGKIRHCAIFDPASRQVLSLKQKDIDKSNVATYKCNEPLLKLRGLTWTHPTKSPPDLRSQQLLL
jgi:hypothetical protein